MQRCATENGKNQFRFISSDYRTSGMKNEHKYCCENALKLRESRGTVSVKIVCGHN